jgi:hypothetical protein
MNPIALAVEGIGFWAAGLPDWDAACAFVAAGTLAADAPAKPSPQLLAPNERRRAPDSVALALDVAQAACAISGRDPRMLASVFASTHGDLAITDYVCDTLATAPESVSPTRFHNSVHNAAAGYWTIGTGCMAATTAISAYDCSFAQALLEAAAQSRESGAPILLVAYDSESRGALKDISPSEGLLAAAMVLNANPGGCSRRTLRLALQPDAPRGPDGALHARYAGNAMAPMLPVFEALATAHAACVVLRASPRQSLRVDIMGMER